MRPIKLTLEGFTSFRQKQTLDFSTLDLFAITGSTGAGKTSLLDAMTFALFGKVARKFNLDELVSQGLSHLTVIFQFSVRNTVYQIKRTRHYQTNRQQPVLIDKWNNGEWQREDSQALETIIGMNFETFTRAILLPQGQFDEFLKGSAVKRRELLRQLWGLEIFENMRQTFAEQSKLSKAEYEGVKRVLESLQLPTEEALAEKQTRLANLETQLVQQKATLESNQLALTEAEQLFKQRQQLTTWQKRFSTLENESATITHLEKRLQQARQADQLSAEWVQVKTIRQDFLKTKQALSHVEHEFKQATQTFQQQWLRLLTDSERRFVAAELSLEATKQYLAELTQNLEEKTFSNQELTQLRETLPDLMQYQEHTKHMQNLQEKHQTVQAQQQRIEQAYPQAQTALETANATLQTAEIHNNSVIQQNQVAHLRSTLQTGELCPVCGGTYPTVEQLPSTAMLSLVDLTPLKKDQQEKTQTLQTIWAEKIWLETQLEALQEISSKEAVLAQLHQRISEILQTTTWDVKELLERYEIAQQEERIYHELRQQKEQIEAQLTIKTHVYQQAHAHYQQTLATDSILPEWIPQQSETIHLEIQNLIKYLPYQGLIKKLENYQNDLAIQIEKTQGTFQTARDHFLHKKAQIARITQENIEAKEVQVHNETLWQQVLQDANLCESAFLEAKASPIQQTLWEKQITVHREQITELKANINTLITAIGGKNMTDTAIQQLHDVKQTVESTINKLEQQVTQLKIDIQEGLNNQQRARNFTQQLATLETQVNLYQTLAKSLRSDEFQAYVLENLEQELVARATLLLQELTDTRYQLAVREGEYWVVDNWNAGEYRRVRTLSGGETFAASLAMALALSEKLSVGTTLGSLFLDEGFGTLDAETMESVTQVLESLRQQDRLIGVITHIPALAERLPTQVKLSKSLEGSTLTIEAF